MSILGSFGIVAVLLMLITLELVRLRRLKERYAVIWVGFAVLLLLGVVFPDTVATVSRRLGFDACKRPGFGIVNCSWAQGLPHRLHLFPG